MNDYVIVQSICKFIVYLPSFNSIYSNTIRFNVNDFIIRTNKYVLAKVSGNSGLITEFDSNRTEKQIKLYRWTIFYGLCCGG